MCPFTRIAIPCSNESYFNKVIVLNEHVMVGVPLGQNVMVGPILPIYINILYGKSTGIVPIGALRTHAS